MLEGQLLGRLFGSPTGVGNGLLGVGQGRGLAEVVGQIGSRRAPGLQGESDAVVQAHSTTRPQLLQQRLADEGVGEAEAVEHVVVLDYETAGAGVVEHGDHLVDVPVDGGGQDGGVEGGSYHGGGPQQLVGGLVEAGQAPADDLPDPLGQADLLDEAPVALPPALPLHQGTGLDEVDEDLTDEERVALRLARDHLGELGHPLRVDLATGRLGQEVRDLVLVQPDEVDALDAGLAAQVGQRGGEGVGPGQVGVPVRAHHEHSGVIHVADQVAQEQEAGLVGPVQVVEDDQDRGLLARPGQEVGDGAEEAEALGVGIGPEGLGGIQPGDEAAEVAAPLAEVGR